MTARADQRAERTSLRIARATWQGQARSVPRVFFTQEEARSGCRWPPGSALVTFMQPYHLF